MLRLADWVPAGGTQSDIVAVPAYIVAPRRLAVSGPVHIVFERSNTILAP